MRKKILFSINTLGRAGAEVALMELLRRIDPEKYEVHLHVITEQGEMIGQVPDHVHFLTPDMDTTPIHSGAGRRRLARWTAARIFRNGALGKNLGYVLVNLGRMIRRGRIQPDKLLWRILADAADAPTETYDLAVAFIEGGAAYFVADRVQARKKVAFIHIDYGQAGYTRKLDGDCYAGMDRIFGVSDEVCDAFRACYPEHAARVEVFHNLLNKERILDLAEEEGGFTDGYTGFRLLTVGRLTAQKATEVSIEAMRLLKDAGICARWYVLGEGDRRPRLEALIRRLGLEEDFLLPGSVENPYPYMRQTDLYVHATRFEGKSIAVQEAQIMGRPVLVSDCAGNREQVTDGADGFMCALDPQSLCEKIKFLIADGELRARCGAAAAKKMLMADEGAEKLLQFCDE